MTPLRCRPPALTTLPGAPGPPFLQTHRRFKPALNFGDSVLPRDDAPKQRLAVLDLGSTSFHLLVADVEPSGKIFRVRRKRVMNRLGEVLAVASELSDPQIAAASKICRELIAIAREEKAEAILPVATAAVRESANTEEVVERLGEALGQPVTVLSGLEEARLIFSAFRSRVPWKKGRALGLDLGGGSLEMVLGTTERVEWEATLPLGAARLTRKFVAGDPVDRSERAALKEHVREQLVPVLAELKKKKFKHVIATGGTIGVLARMLMEDEKGGGENARGFAIDTDSLAHLAKKLCKATSEDRLAMPGMSERRVDLVPAGATIYSVICRSLGIKQLTYSDWGLREGVLLEHTGSSLVSI